MEIKQMMNENIMIGTAILSTFADRKQSDSIDLMLPFVKYALHEKYAIGGTVAPTAICDYIQSSFAFDNLPSSFFFFSNLTVPFSAIAVMKSPFEKRPESRALA